MSIFSNNVNLRGSYKVVILCLDMTTGDSYTVRMPLTIKHICDDSVITPFRSFSKTILLNGQPQTIVMPKFKQTVVGCDTYSFNVTYIVKYG